MGWRRGEVWFDGDGLWNAEPAFALPAPLLELPRFGPRETGLDASRRRRQAAAAERKRRRQTRTAPAVAFVVGSSALLSVPALRQRLAVSESFLVEDPPSLTVRLASAPPAASRPARPPSSHLVSPRIEWARATSSGLPYAGHLHDGTQLPIAGADWVTWNPNTDSSPNRPDRLYGHEHTIRTIVDVLAAYRAANPRAPRVVVGDIALPGGGPMDQHRSHQNGLDVDIYYPRRDGAPRAPRTRAQIDRRLAQDLLDRFVAAGATTVFVGYSTGLHGRSGIVVPYPNHENHMHVRLPAPG